MPRCISIVLIIATTALSISPPGEGQLIPAPYSEYWPGYPSMAGLTEAGWGPSLVTGDFNCDDKSDLAGGLDFDDVDFNMSVVSEAGSIQVIYSGPDGLDLEDVQRLTQGSGFLGAPETGDAFGRVLASGDFDNDGCDDLAVGIENEDIGALENAGAVQVFYGSAAGMTTDQLYFQGNGGLQGVAEAFDRFGSALAVGDFDNDTYDDLAIGAPFETLNSEDSAGALHVLLGGPGGLSTTDNILLHRGVGPIGGTPTAGEFLATSLAAGRASLDSRALLVIGVPGTDVAGHQSAGSAILLPDATADSPPPVINEIHQGLPNIPGAAEALDRFGDSVVAGDFDGNGNVDIAVGIPNEAVGAVMRAGAVNVLFLGAGAPAAQLWTRPALPGMLLVAIPNSNFGRHMTVGDFDYDGGDDLVVHEFADYSPRGGDVHLLTRLGTGSPFLLTLSNSQDDFGEGLTAGRFAGPQSGLELVVGINAKEVAGVQTGTAQFFANVMIFSDGFESGDTSSWSSSSP